ncbi:hypothetical protein MGG_14851 [Pyricularia oryzae 70-15]|uniref:Uncharacterized protein n=2 Tax=Pyricularia oryzae TaxID=318829 RepID=G4N6X4_PYRO7|nr:uncharacterized protein MGG_14851 [Pyricularia oryzae 70-15]EHA50738.1 hypothetical protein MGG_14851 [Pyricularia oryzae 70-15]
MASTTLLRGRGPRAAAIGAATASVACSWRTIATACLSHKQTVYGPWIFQGNYEVFYLPCSTTYCANYIRTAGKVAMQAP